MFGLDGFLVTNYASHYAANMFYQPTNNTWYTWWSNNGDDHIGGFWNIESGDEYYPIISGGITLMFCLNRSLNNHCMLLNGELELVGVCLLTFNMVDFQIGTEIRMIGI